MLGCQVKVEKNKKSEESQFECLDYWITGECFTCSSI